MQPESIEARPDSARAGAVPYDLIELLFFAYRDFVSDPDRILADYGFGRAHHRVLHFVQRRPGLTIAELLDILQITKQSLNRVLKELVETGFVEQRTGTQDKRQRKLHTTPAGQDLAMRLVQLQATRISSALEGLGPDGGQAVARYLSGLIDASERNKVLGFLQSPAPPQASRD
ncbi:MarR family winged helix-turn-helix transcriptional regulator [Bosea sp. PAMC 26642]|uniref:MarR family winged helix-turn-helix transcriptional regulator n=1 Tax=Bosea sp. (strain PAMC 26642) TaxID=1792307 RepID=UPI00076FF32A|nr:MarR family transcriptional regulator [Bosea sp. PAMC 26642]AMJ60836.1 transcriptional regulator [Bosea sp. PAMC 26642]